MAIGSSKGSRTVTKVKTPKPVPGSKGWGSIRAAEYGVPSLAMSENLPFTTGRSADNEEQFAYKESKTPSTAGKGGGLSALDRYTRQLQGMLTGGTYQEPYNDLLTRLNSLYGGEDNQSGAKGRINTGMNELETFLKGQANPYAGFKAQAAQTTPELAKFLESQGVQKTPLEQYATTVNAQNLGGATAFQNLADTMSNMYGADLKERIGDVGVQRQNLLNDLEMSRLGFGSQLAQKGFDQKQELMKMLLTALSKGGKPAKGDLF